MKNVSIFKYILLIFTTIGLFQVKAQEKISLPKDGETIDFLNYKNKITTTWDLESVERGQYYFNFYSGKNNNLTLQFNKDNNGMSFLPLKSQANEILIEFYKDGKVIHSYKDNEKNSGPNVNDFEFEVLNPTL